jgi:peptidoglycan/xylan/chitin deacetylase (PgdA/CDA1 family)
MESTNLRGKIERRMARLLGGRRLWLPRDRAIVSFSFDDVPLSACETGASILEAAGARGTYYVCGGLEGGGNGTMFDAASLRRLNHKGHEIGSHGFAHLDYQSITAAEVETDIRRNDDYFEAVGLPRATTFAYPYGCVNPAVKRVCGERFVASRGVESRANIGSVDLDLVKAVRLYAHSTSESLLAAEFRRAKLKGGWIVIMTHAVTESPGDFDASPDLLQTAVGLAGNLGFAILSVAAVCDELHGTAAREFAPEPTKRRNGKRHE